MNRSKALRLLYSEVPENTLGSKVWFIYNPNDQYLEGVYGTYFEACARAVDNKGFFSQDGCGRVLDGQIKNVRGMSAITKEEVYDLGRVRETNLGSLAEIASDLGFRYFANREGQVYRIVDSDLTLQYIGRNIRDL